MSGCIHISRECLWRKSTAVFEMIADLTRLVIPPENEELAKRLYEFMDSFHHISLGEWDINEFNCVLLATKNNIYVVWIIDAFPIGPK